jgi:hypothetical protein
MSFIFFFIFIFGLYFKVRYFKVYTLGRYVVPINIKFISPMVYILQTLVDATPVDTRDVSKCEASQDVTFFYK